MSSPWLEGATNKATMNDWQAVLDTAPSTQVFRDWIERHCIISVAVFDFDSLCQWPWTSEAYIDVTSGEIPSRGAKLFELQPVVRQLQATLEHEFESFGKMCSAVYESISTLENQTSQRAALNSFLYSLMINLGNCAKHVLNGQSSVNLTHYNPIFCAAYLMPEPMKNVLDDICQYVSSRFGESLHDMESGCKMFNDHIQLAILLAFLANSHYSVMRRTQYKSHFMNIINKCILLADAPKEEHVKTHAAALLVASYQINPDMRRLLMQKACGTMSEDERQDHLTRMSKLQPLNELIILNTALKSLASQLSPENRTILMSQLCSNFKNVLVE